MEIYVENIFICFSKSILMGYNFLAVLWLRAVGIIFFRCLFLFCLEHRRHSADSFALYRTIKIGDFLSFSLLFIFLPQLVLHAKLVKESSLTSFELTIGFTIPITVSCRWCLKVHLWMVHVGHWSHGVVVAFAKLASLGPYWKIKETTIRNSSRTITRHE